MVAHLVSSAATFAIVAFAFDFAFAYFVSTASLYCLSSLRRRNRVSFSSVLSASSSVDCCETLRTASLSTSLADNCRESDGLRVAPALAGRERPLALRCSRGLVSPMREEAGVPPLSLIRVLEAGVPPLLLVRVFRTSGEKVERLLKALGGIPLPVLNVLGDLADTAALEFSLLKDLGGIPLPVLNVLGDLADTAAPEFTVLKLLGGIPLPVLNVLGDLADTAAP